MRVEPAFSSAISGACRARTPISPAAPGTITISASSSKTAPSGVVSEIANLCAPSATCESLGGNGLGLFRLFGLGLGLSLRRLLGLRLRLARLLACLRNGVVDRADHVEGLLGQVVVLAVEDLGEAADRVLELDVLPGLAGERLGHEHRLREIALDLARPLDRQAVL